MDLLGILRNKRNSLLRDDELILLLILARGPTRPHRLRDQSALPERSFWRAFNAIQRQEWAITTERRPEDEPRSRGKFTRIRLTVGGEEMVRSLYRAASNTPSREDNWRLNFCQDRSKSSLYLVP